MDLEFHRKRGRRAACMFTSALLAAAAAPVPAADWYVAPNGSDAAAGSQSAPFASVQRAHDAAEPGDTVIIRGGTYRIPETAGGGTRGLYARITNLTKSGTKDRPITFRAADGETPVFDCSAVKPRGKRVSAFHVSGSWLRIQGLEVTGVQVTVTRHTQSICFESNGSHNVFDRLRMHDGQAIGIYHLRGSDNLFINCDAWNNRDYTSEDAKGGNVDGFGCHPDKGSTGNVFRGCRAWFNSDDGYDCLGAHEPVVFENCWALYNGFTPAFERAADGNGFKAGGYGSASARDLPSPVPRHVVRNCIAVRNKSSGFYANHHPGGCDWSGNAAWKNSADFNMLNRLADNRTDVDGFGHRLTGNISFEGRRSLTNINLAKCELKDNLFGAESGLREEDFLSLDERELLQPRGPGGELPKTQFMKLRPGRPKRK